MFIGTKGLFHYTNSVDSIISILNRGFLPSYCKEEILFGTEKHSYAIPIVSFCDIPLNQIKDHMNDYGNYAIGLNDEWKFKNKLNPVI